MPPNWRALGWEKAGHRIEVLVDARVQTPGRHSFRLWRRFLAQSAPLLFSRRKT
jgi:hypothetical protein